MQHYKIFRLTPDLKKLRLAGIWRAPDGRLAQCFEITRQAQCFEIRRQTQHFKIFRQTQYSVTMCQTCIMSGIV